MKRVSKAWQLLEGRLAAAGRKAGSLASNKYSLASKKKLGNVAAWPAALWPLDR